MEQKGVNGIVLIGIKVQGVNSDNIYKRPRWYKNIN